MSPSRKKSEELYQQASRLMPGGVSSPVRAFGSVGGTPVYYRSARGSEFTDEDGNHYVDYCMSWGPLILGHAHPAVVEALARAAAKGTSYGAPTSLEIELAELVIDMVPSIERIRFVNSGTEATMSALRLARAYTGRSKIVKFEGCYHGHSDALLVKAGSGTLTLGVPTSPGVPASVAEHTMTLTYNDLDSVAEAVFTVGEDWTIAYFNRAAEKITGVPKKDIIRAAMLYGDSP